MVKLDVKTINEFQPLEWESIDELYTELRHDQYGFSVERVNLIEMELNGVTFYGVDLSTISEIKYKLNELDRFSIDGLFDAYTSEDVGYIDGLDIQAYYTTKEGAEQHIKEIGGKSFADIVTEYWNEHNAE